jgi:DNA-binding MarR family transcriptional regulator
VEQQTYQSGFLFTQAHKLVRARIYNTLEPYGLNPSYWAILSAAVAAPDGIRLAYVAKAMDVKAPLITMLSNDLIKMELINRVPHPIDKRAKLLIATQKGKHVFNKVEQELSEDIAYLVQGLSPDELHNFRKGLETIIRNATSETRP